MTKEIIVHLEGFCGLANITQEVEQAVSDSKIADGIVVVFIFGSTGGVTTIEYEEGLLADFKNIIEQLIPQNNKYRHNAHWKDGNGFSHLRASLLKPSLAIPIVKGKLTLGTWQQIVVMNFDNQMRERKVIIKVLAG